VRHDPSRPLLVKCGQIRCNYNIFVHASWRKAVGRAEKKGGETKGGKREGKKGRRLWRKRVYGGKGEVGIDPPMS